MVGSDNDGIPDLEDGDSDGDGIGNGEEIQAGSDPNDKASAPAAAGPVTEGPGGKGCGATGFEALLALGALAFFRRWRRKNT